MCQLRSKGEMKSVSLVELRFMQRGLGETIRSGKTDIALSDDARRVSFEKLSGEGLIQMMPNEAGVMVASELRQTTILVIDDDELVRQSLGAILGVYGLNVLFAPNGQIALQVFQEHVNEIDVILLDLVLPDMSGELVFQRIRAIRADSPVIVMSGHAESSIASRFQSESNVAFLSKPSPISELISRINQTLGKG
jgi:CheY-like chemotaxis protein